jgi:VWFA-related protein
MRHSSAPISVIVALLLATLVGNSLAQAPQTKRPKLKDFGKSLKRLRWDPSKNAAVESRPPRTPGGNAEQDDVIRINTDLVTCDVLVVDPHGNVVRGLTANDFTITEDGQPQQVGHFLLGDNISVPRTIVLIFDYSGSQRPFLRNSVDAAKLMVDKLAPLDRMAIVTDDVELLIDFTADKKKLKEKLESLVERTRPAQGFLGFFGSGGRLGKSAQYSSLMATFNEAFIEEDRRPIIVFQTDGDQIYYLRNALISPRIPPDLPEDLKAEALEGLAQRMNSISERMVEFSLADVYRAADQSRATIYTVIPGFQLVGRTPEEQVARMKKDVERRLEDTFAGLKQADRDGIKATFERWRYLSPENLLARTQDAVAVQTALAAVAPRTGGWTEFLETPEQADGIYTRILADINQRYIIGYYPTNKERNGKRRKIKFEMRGHPDYEILGRTFYVR